MSTSGTTESSEAKAASGVRIGAWSIMGGRGAVEALCRSGVDFIGIDAQHGYFAFDEAALCVQIANLCGVQCFVRIPIDQVAWLPRYLDAGADGVILAMVSTVAEVERAVRLSRYQPQGRRSWAGGKRNGVGEVTTVAGVREQFVPEILPMIETAEGLGHVEEIAAVPGIAGLYVGPVDLGLAMEGTPRLGDDASPWRKGVESVVRAARENGIRPGMFAIDGDDARNWTAIGFKDIVLSSDVALLRRSLDDELRRARTAVSATNPLRSQAADPWRGWSPALYDK
jgi:4-hydroxy-2-oxoheptanedioate aldolase